MYGTVPPAKLGKSGLGPPEIEIRTKAPKLGQHQRPGEAGLHAAARGPGKVRQSLYLCARGPMDEGLTVITGGIAQYVCQYQCRIGTQQAFLGKVPLQAIMPEEPRQR